MLTTPQSSDASTAPVTFAASAGAPAADAPPRHAAEPGAEPSVVVSFDGVAHSYQTDGGRLEALARIDLDVPRGQFVAILGPSGCGKSTLLRIASGLLRPSAGTVRLCGRSVREARRDKSIGWLAQDDGLLPWRRVLDNVGLPLRLAHHAPSASSAAAVGSAARSADSAAAAESSARASMAMLERVGLADVARRYPHELSGGMRQRVALARAVVANPPILLLDEPFAHLDELTRERLGELLLRLRASDPPTTLLVTHSVAEAVRLADRIVMMSDRPGQIRRDVLVDLPRPRTEIQPGFGQLIHDLKCLL